MPYTLKTQQISVKDPDSGEYIGVDVLAEQNKESLIAEIQSEGDLQVERVDQKSAEILAAGDAQVTRINQTGTNVQTLVDQEEARAQQIVTDAQTSLNTLEAQKNTIAETVASMAELGTDTTLTTPGMAADAKAVGDVKGEVDNLGDFVYDQDSGLSTKAPAITDSASSGDIVTFDSDVEGCLVSKLIGTIEPIQNLHGYDYPWPGGGNDNKFDEETVVGRWKNADGTFDASATEWTSSENPIPVVAGQSNYINMVAYRIYYDSSMGYVGYDGNGTNVATTPANAAYMHVSQRTDEWASNVIVAISSTAVPYSPYSNECPIGGHTGMTVTRTGKNLLDMKAYKNTSYNSPAGSQYHLLPANSNYINNGDGSYTYKSTIADWDQCSLVVPLNDIGDYRVSIPLITGGPTMSWCILNKNMLQIGPSTVLGNTVPDNYNCGFTVHMDFPGYLVLYLAKRSGNDITLSYPMVELGSTASTYEPYTGSTIPISFPTEAGTVYSGMINPISGKLVVDSAYFTADENSNVSVWTSATSPWYGFAFDPPTRIDAERATVMCDKLPSSLTGVVTSWNCYKVYGTIYVCINDAVLSERSIEATRAWLGLNPLHFVAKLATPIEYQCTPAEVKTLLGTNNIWLDTGSITECVYPKDTKKYIDNKSVIKAPVIINHAEGEIASFTDGAEDMPVKSLVASIEPVQDLHGYDSPWPGGGGKNKFSGQWPPDVMDTYAGWEVPATTSSRLAIYDKGNNADISGVYFGMSDNGISAPATWLVTNGVIQEQNYNQANSCYVITYTNPSLRKYVSVYPPTQESINKILNRFNVICFVDDDLTDTWSYFPYSNLCPISGHTGLTVTRTGKNLFDMHIASGDPNINITLDKPLFGTITVSAKANNVVLSEAVWRIKMTKRDGTDQYITDTGAKSYAMPYTFTINESNPVVAITIRSATMNAGSYDFCIKYGTDTTYEPYTGTTIPITWETEAGTVYGGYVDVIGGKIVVTKASVDLGSLTWAYNASRQMFQNNLTSAADKPVGVICSNYKTIPSQYDQSDNTIGLTQWTYLNGQINVVDHSFNGDTAAFKTAMNWVIAVYELVTPIEYQLTPSELTTLLGTNNIWTDAGSVSVDYSADTKLFIQNAIAEALANSSNP